AQPKFEHGWAGVQNKAELEQKIKTENPKNIPPSTRAAARPAGSASPGIGESPAAGGARPPISPGPRGKAGRTLPGATAAPAGGARVRVPVRLVELRTFRRKVGARQLNVSASALRRQWAPGKASAAAENSERQPGCVIPAARLPWGALLAERLAQDNRVQALI